MELSIQEALAARIVGEAVVRYLKQAGYPPRLAMETGIKAMQALEEIRRVLDDGAADDPECFRRIEEIVRVLESYGIGTIRHDW